MGIAFRSKGSPLLSNHVHQHTLKIGAEPSFPHCKLVSPFRDYEGILFDPYGPNPCAGNGGCGRPHILYKSSLRRYVLWVNAGTTGYPVAISSSPSVGFQFLNATAPIDSRFAGLIPADFSVEILGSHTPCIVTVEDAYQRPTERDFNLFNNKL